MSHCDISAIVHEYIEPRGIPDRLRDANTVAGSFKTSEAVSEVAGDATF